MVLLMITGNTIMGIDKTDTIAQHGIEVARHAVVLPSYFTGNTISGNFFNHGADGPNFQVQSCGVLYVEAGSKGYEGQLNSSNTLRHNRPQVWIVP